MDEREESYILEDQIGFLLRLAYQRHLALFSEKVVCGLTPPQFSTLYRLREAAAPISQNALGRLVGMDAATTKGVVSRLLARNLVRVERDSEDLRRYTLFMTDEGCAMLDAIIPDLREITELTLSPLSPEERMQLVALIKKII